jgi:hypothetical protein
MLREEYLRRLALIEKQARVVTASPDTSRPKSIRCRIFEWFERGKLIGWANMKRGLLFGLGASLCLGILFGLVELFNDVTTATIMVAISVPSSIFVIREANRAPPNRSRVHGVIGWFVGFLIIEAVLLCIFGIIVVFSPWPS